MAIAEVLCHEITEADIRKINATSNDALTGGGARDLRFSIDCAPCLNRFFPQEVSYEGHTPYRIGEFEHYDARGNRTVELVRYAFQPTDARPREVRIAQISKLGFFLDLPEINENDGVLFMAFIRKTDGIPQAQYLTERQIAADGGNPIICAAMREALNKHKGNKAVVFSAELKRGEEMQDELMGEANKILEFLAEDKNVLLTGAPATGKTTLLNMVERLFLQRGETIVDPYGPVAFPSSAASDADAFPGKSCKNRKVFRTTFHQGTKYRDFVRGLIPVPGSDSVRFEVSKGLLWQAAEYAKHPDSASLLIIDEINRGPAVSIFGDIISAFEADKRLGDDGKIIPGKTVTVQILNDNAQLEDYQLPSRLYILAAMNQADSSVEPMDAAFMRRWRRVKLSPSIASLCNYFGIERQKTEHPNEPMTAKDVYAAAVDALTNINYKIGLGRGDDYKIGQGVFMKCPKGELPQDVSGALRYIADCWPVVDAHIEEVFFNDKEAIAFVLNAGEGSFFKVSDFTFAGRQVIAIEQKYVTAQNVYSMLLSLLG